MTGSDIGNDDGRRRQPRAWPFLLFFLLQLAFLLHFADRDGYEGDDLNTVVPMMHLDAAKQGSLLVYRIAWQPLTYELGAAVYRVTGSPEPVFFLAPIAAAIALTLLFRLAWRERTARVGLFGALATILMMPEYWFSGLYFNSTILGLPFAVWAVLIVRAPAPWFLGFLAGVLAGTAALLRFDFVLAVPFLACCAWIRSRSLVSGASVALGAVVALGTAWCVGLLDLAQVAEIARDSSAEMAAKADLPGWDLRVKLGVLAVLLSPVGWVVLLLGGPLLLRRAVGNAPRESLLLLLAAAPLLLPLTSMLSVKYALPLGTLMPILLMGCLDAIAARWPARLGRALVPCVTVGCALCWLLSLSFYGRSPYVTVGLAPDRPVPTHDGNRGFGGYWWTMMAIDAPGNRARAQVVAAELFAQLRQPGPDVAIVGGENYFDAGGIGWRHLQLLLEREGIRGKLTAPHVVEFEVGQRRVFLATDLPGHRDLALIDLRGVPVDQAAAHVTAIMAQGGLFGPRGR